MNRSKRFLAMLLAVCMMLSIVPAAFAAAPSSLTIAKLAAASESVAATLDSAIKAGAATNGVYADVVVPSEIAVGTYTMGVEDYILMAAQAINDIAGGAASSAAIAYKDITLTGDDAQGTNLTSVTKGMILDLARRVEKYGLAANELPTSFNRPSDGSSTYEGRLCIYSIGSIFAQALASYAANGSLPASVTFAPSSYTTSETSAPQEPETEPTEPEPVWPVSEEYAGVIEAAMEIKAYVEDKEMLPASITINGNVCTMAEAEDLMMQVIVNINSNSTSTALEYIDLADAANPSETITAGNIALTEYIDMAGRNMTWNRANSAAANYTTTSLGRIHYFERVYFNAKILAYYAENVALPATMGVDSWYATSGTAGDATFGNDFSAYAQYLVPTANCQSTNATIMSVAKTAMYCPSSNSHYGKVYANPSSTYEAIWNVMEYITWNTDYQYYANTSKGALGTWNARAGNCCDMGHLITALSRSLGVPARYEHWNCAFSGGNEGHVWSAVYIPDAPSGTNGNEGNWFYADPVNNTCHLGYQSFGLNYEYGDSNCAELPF